MDGCIKGVEGFLPRLSEALIVCLERERGGYIVKEARAVWIVEVGREGKVVKEHLECRRVWLYNTYLPSPAAERDSLSGRTGLHRGFPCREKEKQTRDILDQSSNIMVSGS